MEFSPVTFAMLANAGVAVAAISTVIWVGASRWKARALLGQQEQAKRTQADIEELRREMRELMAQQSTQFDDLYERIEFTERLLTQAPVAPPRETTPV
ncbi:MAG: hypothetical protein O7I93_12315 [Gemmatimonadetes bacterium]|nr:hypothetical protein [Gemmatimonadota bacterium]